MFHFVQVVRIRALVIASAALTAAAASAATSDRQEIEAATNGEWLTLTGRVSQVTGERFLLDYGRDTIPVEMDDRDWRNENALEPGDRVTVSGRMDKDFFEDRKIEARTVYVTSRNELFLADATDEEQGFSVPFVHRPMRKDEERDELQDDEWVQLTGRWPASGRKR